MNEAETIEMLLQIDEALSTQIEFWLTGTFALIITTFLVGARFSRPLRWLLAVLYTLFSATFFVRWALIGSGTKWGIDKLAALAPDHPYTVAEPANAFIGYATASLIIIGTASTIYFLFKSEQLVNREPDRE